MQSIGLSSFLALDVVSKSGAVFFPSRILEGALHPLLNREKEPTEGD